jgi:addiction module HigA family antidote
MKCLIKMKNNKRKPTHPGVILAEHYIKPLKLNLQKLADDLGISRNDLCKIIYQRASITPKVALALSETFDTTDDMWINLQKNFSNGRRSSEF